ncbi:MAG: prolyl oligopeptidase family serine peptidase [Chloroflexi bacterium]|nr:prolyl oligopeptidase family serine peptidase [Chloroflexota bacterium]
MSLAGWSLIIAGVHNAAKGMLVLIPVDRSADAHWKQRFRVPYIAWSSRAAQNPARGLVASNKDGVYQLYAWNTETDKLTQLTDDPAGVGDGAISADGESVYYLRDRRGDEIGHYVRLPVGGGEAEDITPDAPEYASHFIAESASGGALGFCAVDDDGFHLHVYDESGAAEPIFSQTKGALSFGPLLSQDAEIAIIASSEKTGNAEFALEAWDVGTGEQIAELWDGAGSGIIPGEFSPVPGDMRFAGSSSAGGYHRPFIWNPRTGERVEIVSEQFRGDVKFWNWSPDGARLLLHQISGATHALYIYEIAAARLRRLATPDGVFYKGSGFLPGDRLQIHFEHSTAPPRLLEVDVDSGAILRDVIDLGLSVPASVSWRSVNYHSTDGSPIQAWLATPPGAGPYPTIVHTHGGPTAVMTNRWAPESQAWLDHGFAFFSLNYRGSTTFGYDFQHAIDGNLGDLEVEDVAAGVDWLIENGIARADAIFKTGGSYGGYLTLQSLGLKPELWAGGMAVVAIADWTLMYEDQAGTLRGYQRSMFGGSPDEKPEAHRKSSPITYAEQIAAPILVLQGENDTRCPARQMRVYEERLKELGKPIEVHWFDAGHGSLDTEEQIRQQEMMLEFAYRVLGR